ncbi:PIG-L deacetylase family protein [Roseateles sp. P5_E7]
MILIISPHLDDAMLSCCDHALTWRRQGHDVRVLTLFSAAGPCVSPVLGAASFDAAGHMRRRRQEDVAALAAIGLKAEHLGLVDAGFRGSGSADFQTLDQLLCGGVGPGGGVLLEQAAQALQSRFIRADRVMCPLAVGGHVDHVITRRACEAAFDAQLLGYYADMPYARAPWRWRPAQLAQLLRARRSWRGFSANKATVLRHYRSQMPLLFRSRPYFPELVLGPL